MIEAEPAADTPDKSETRQAADAAGELDCSRRYRQREARRRVCRKLALFSRQSPVTDSANSIS